MKKNLYLYLFIFASLIALVFYINGRKYQEKLETQVTQLRKNVQERENLIDSLELTIAESKVHSFSLENNSEAEDYLYKSGWAIKEVKQKVTDQLLELNLKEGGNPLIPYIGQGRGFQISNLKFVNHKWVLVNYYDGDQWGDALIQYNFTENGTVELKSLESLLYLN